MVCVVLIIAMSMNVVDVGRFTRFCHSFGSVFFLFAFLFDLLACSVLVFFSCFVYFDLVAGCFFSLYQLCAVCTARWCAVLFCLFVFLLNAVTYVN